MPEETDRYIHWPIRDKSDFVQESFRTITISAREGIKAVIGKLKSDPDGSTHIQKYLFDKSKGWTMEKVRRWVQTHKGRNIYEVCGRCFIEDREEGNEIPDEAFKT